MARAVHVGKARQPMCARTVPRSEGSGNPCVWGCPASLAPRAPAERVTAAPHR